MTGRVTGSAQWPRASVSGTERYRHHFQRSSANTMYVATYLAALFPFKIPNCYSDYADPSQSLALVELSRPESSVTPILWDRSDVPLSMSDPSTSNCLVSLNSTEYFRGDPPKQQFFRYVPLVQNGQYTTGITSYWRSVDPYHCELIGLGNWFDGKECISGSADGIPVYFPLAPNERVAFVWVLRPRPALTVRRNLL